jgi:hypothetical protein
MYPGSTVLLPHCVQNTRIACDADSAHAEVLVMGRWYCSRFVNAQSCSHCAPLPLMRICNHTHSLFEFSFLICLSLVSCLSVTCVCSFLSISSCKYAYGVLFN